MDMKSLPGRYFPQGTSVGEYIVTILKDYNKSLPVEFLANLLDRDESEIQSELKILERDKIVIRQNDKIRLTHRR